MILGDISIPCKGKKIALSKLILTEDNLLSLLNHWKEMLATLSEKETKAVIVTVVPHLQI